MAAKRERRRSDGTIAYQAVFRHLGRQTSATFDTARARDRFVRLCDEIGVDAALELLQQTEVGGGSAPTLKEYALTAIDNRTGILEGTRHRYKREIEREWGTLGGLPVDLVTTAHVEAWVRERERSGDSAKTIRNKHGLLSSVLKKAASDKSVGLAANPCDDVNLAKDGVRGEMVFLTPGEFAVFLGCVPTPYKPFVTALFGMGLRFSEATAAQVSAYDPERRRIAISRAWKKIPGGWEIGPPKTRRGRRDVGLPEQLWEHCDTAKAERAPDDLLFTNTNGGRIMHKDFHSKVWTPAVRLANGEHGHSRPVTARSMWWGMEPMQGEFRLGKRPRIHDARHSAASWMLAAGATLQDVQYALGHESITTTSDRYGHLLPGRGDAVAAAMTLALSQALPQIEG